MGLESLESKLPEGVITEKGLRQNINVGILYLEAWLGGSGAVPIAATMRSRSWPAGPKPASSAQRPDCP